MVLVVFGDRNIADTFFLIKSQKVEYELEKVECI